MAWLEKSFKTMILMVTAPFLLLHLGVTVWAAIELPQRATIGVWLDGMVVAVAVIFNLVGLVTFYVTHFRKQEFENSDSLS